MMMMDDQMSSDSSSAEFAPSTGAQHRTASLFVSLQSPEDPSGPPTQDASPHNDTLPSLQDRSWIGARMSPILLLNQDNDDNNTSRQHNVRLNNQQPQQQHKPLLQDDYYYARLQPPSSSQQQLPHHQHHDIHANPFFMGHHAQQQQQPPPNYAYPSAGHLRTEYPAFGIHPLQSEHSLRQMHADQQARQHQKQVWSSWGTLVCVVSGLSLLGMAVYDIVCYYHVAMDDSTNTNSNSHAWSLPWGQPTLATGLVWGGLSPSAILTEEAAVEMSTNNNNNANNFLQLWPVLHILSTYCRLVTSALQVHSVLEWCLVVLGWFVCQRPSQYPVTTTTTITVYTLSVLTGQLWMLAVWWIHGSGDNVSYKHATLLVAHCASWGTCGVLCFVGMVRPQRRFGCFMICIGLLVLSLLQALWILPANGGHDDDKNGSNNQMVNNNDNSYYDYSSAIEQRNAAFLPRNPLPLVIGCAVSSFVGWALYGSQMIGVVRMQQATANSNIMKQHRGGGAQRVEQFSVGMSHKNIAASTQSSVSTGIRFFCAVAVVMAWIIPLLVLAYFDYYYYNHGDRHSNSSSSATIST